MDKKKLKEMEEIEYIDSIDACFPYENEMEWKTAIDKGISINDNCAYMALHEICCGLDEIPESNLLGMIEYWDSKYSHPTKNMLLEVAAGFVKGNELSEDKALKYLDIIANYTGLYNAANIILLTGPEKNEKIEQKHAETVNKWRS